jgi:hypothetical protein
VPPSGDDRLVEVGVLRESHFACHSRACSRHRSLPKSLRFATGSVTEDLLLILIAEMSLALYSPLLFRN